MEVGWEYNSAKDAFARYELTDEDVLGLRKEIGQVGKCASGNDGNYTTMKL